MPCHAHAMVKVCNVCEYERCHLFNILMNGLSLLRKIKYKNKPTMVARILLYLFQVTPCATNNQ